MVGNPVDQKPIAGTTTIEEGSFVLETNARDFYIEVSFIGFTTKRFDNPAIVDGKINLGAVTISEDSQQLDEVVVEGEISDNLFMDFGARKKILIGKAILNIRDVFASSESITVQPNFHLRDFSQQGSFITFGVSLDYGRGKPWNSRDKKTSKSQR